MEYIARRSSLRSHGWDDIIIGKGDKGCNSMKCYDIPGDHGISENMVSFWISDLPLEGVGMTIFKNTTEGKKLMGMIYHKRPLKVINDFLIGIALKRIKVSTFKTALNQLTEGCVREGENSKIREIQNVLSI